MGVEKAIRMQTGRYIPADEEKGSLLGCFEENVSDQVALAFVPPPVQKVLVLEERSDLVSDIVLSKEKVTEGDTSKVYTKISGRGGAANSFVYVCIHFEPIVVTVDIDSNGNWSYLLKRDLEEGSHRVYVASRNDNNDLVRSEVIHFEIVRRAEAVGSGDDFDIIVGDSEEPYNYFTINSLLAIAGGIIGIIIIFWAFYAHKMFRKIEV